MVLTQAGVTDRTKRPWTVNALKAEVSRANASPKTYKSASGTMVELLIVGPHILAGHPKRCLSPRRRPRRGES